MRRNRALAVGLCAAIFTAGVQAQPPGAIPPQISDEALKKAMDEARAKTEQINRSMGAATPSVAPRSMPNITNEKLRAMQPADPAALARSYAETARLPNLPKDELLVFISLSMPAETLRLLGAQAKRAHAVLVLRGLKNGLAKGSYAETLKALKPIAETGASVQISPEVFAKYSVEAVPTFVLAAQPAGGCGNEQCAWQAESVRGDVSLDYALEHFTKRGGVLGKMAEMRLQNMGKGRN